jgi:hypothetical protein
MCSEHTDPSAEASPRSASRAFDRRDFLKLSGAGLLGVVLLGSGGLGKVFAQAGPLPEPSLVAEFEQAAEEYGVPVELLMAMGYVNTRWDMPPPEASAYRWGDLHGLGSYGIMALVQNPYSDTLGEASRLTGIPQEVLKTDRAANIRGGAALLASSAGGYASGDLSDYFGAVVGRGLGAGKSYIAVTGIGGGELYAEQVFGTLRTGAYRTMSSGETISLPLRMSSSGIRNIHGR